MQKYFTSFPLMLSLAKLIAAGGPWEMYEDAGCYDMHGTCEWPDSNIKHRSCELPQYDDPNGYDILPLPFSSKISHAARIPTGFVIVAWAGYDS